MTNLQALAVLMAARQEPVRVTFTNARKYMELSEKITRNVGVHPEEFDESLDRFIANNPEGFTQETIMAMFIPNTYEVYFNIVPDELVARLYEEYKKFWNESRLAKAKALGLTPIEVSTLASIVQAENHREDEAPRKKKDFDDQKSRAKVRLPSVRDAVLRTLNEAGVEIPYPQRVLRRSR